MSKIDVIIPAYNSGCYIKEALNSVLVQTLKPSKIIVVDDGSTDETVNIIENFKKNSNVGIELHCQENRGPNAARNAGLKHSDSEFIAFLDADDIWDEKKLEKQMEVFEKSEFENLGLVYTAYDLIDEERLKVKPSFLVLKLNPNFRGYVFDKMFDAMKITGSCSGVLIKKVCFEKTGLFDETLKGAEDWDMWIRISTYFEIDYVNEVLVHVRLHKSNSHYNQIMMAKNMIMFIKKWSVILDENHPGRIQLAKKSFDYFFKALFLLKFKTALKMLKLFDEVLSKNEREIIFAKTKGSVFLFMVFSFPDYFMKQMRRIIDV